MALAQYLSILVDEAGADGDAAFARALLGFGEGGLEACVAGAHDR